MQRTILQKNTLHAASCNILSQDAYARNACFIMPPEKRRAHFIATMKELIPEVDLFCFQEWDYDHTLGYCHSEIKDFFIQSGYNCIQESMSKFGRIIFYKKERFTYKPESYKEALFGESVIYGYLSITLFDTFTHKSIGLTTVHLPYHRKKNCSAESFLRAIPQQKNDISLLCGDFNSTTIDLRETPFSSCSLSQLPPEKSHRLDLSRTAYQSVDYWAVSGATIKNMRLLPENREQLISHTYDTRESSYFSDHAIVLATFEIK